MDKLEKALEKAKEQHATIVAPDAGAAPAPPPPEIESTLPPVNAYVMDSNRIVAHLTRSKEADVYRQLRTKVFQLMRENGYKTLAITSPNYGDGKTTVAMNLCIGLTLGIRRQVLLVDLDLRKPYLARFFRLTAAAGVTSWPARSWM